MGQVIKMRLPLLLGLLLSLLATGQVALSHQRYEMAKKITATQHERQALLGKVNQLGLELASLMRPERIRRLAASELGMGPPGPMQVIRP